MSRNPFKRRALRIIAIQALYQMDICKDLSEFDAVRLALDVLHDEQSFDEEVYSNEALLDEFPEIHYSLDLIQGVQNQLEEIDALISSHLKGWELSRIVRLDLMIMRVAVCEMRSPELEVPQTVALNEAIEIAKLYSDEKSAKFINGVLSNFVEG